MNWLIRWLGIEDVHRTFIHLRMEINDLKFAIDRMRQHNDTQNESIAKSINKLELIIAQTLPKPAVCEKKPSKNAKKPQKETKHGKESTTV